MDRKRNKDETTRKGFWPQFFGTYAIPLIAFTIFVVIIIIVVVVFTVNFEETLPIPESDRIECPGLTVENCTENNCYYQKVKIGPSCYMNKDSFGYRVQNVNETDRGVEIKLKSIVNKTPYGSSITNVVFSLTYLTNNIVRFQFKDADHQLYEVPVQNDFPLLQNISEINNQNISYEANYTSQAQEVFHFSVRRNDGTVLWDTSIGALLLSPQYLQIGSYLPSKNIYGLGEHMHDTLRHKLDFRSWPMFSRDRFPSSTMDQKNLYGVHPFYTCLEASGASNGVFFLNSNAMEATLLPAPAITFRTIGGILDFFIFVGDNPEHVIQLYTSLIGRPMLPPYWSLGFQLCRYGYSKIGYLSDVMNRTRKARIPQAVQFLDIDHMMDARDFTYDEKSFPELPQFINEQREYNGIKWIIILDPAIAVDDGYKTWTSGLESNVFIKRANFWSAKMFPGFLQQYDFVFGKVWPQAYAAFPDFFLSKTKEWWKQNIVDHWSNISFDGLWIDMNEPANFETNSPDPSFCRDDEFMGMDCKALVCPTSNYEDPPYNPVLKITGDRLSEKTLCMESLQGDDSSNDTCYRHYDVHSLYGWSQSQPTLEAAQKATGTRSLVISRSTYPSSGRYAGHWLGDNHSEYEDMRNSIIGMLEFNMFGIPYIGADVCGFVGKAEAHLCKRWMQLGAFYPFYRNHNAVGEQPQDPAVFGEEVAGPSRRAIERRITLNPYLYTLFYRAHTDGSTVVRPLFHEFPKDEITWDMYTQFMWGKSLLITPNLDMKRKSVNKYLPKGEWWYFDYEKSRQEKHTGGFVLDLADAETPVHVRGGTILPMAIFNWDEYPESDNATTRKIDLYIFPEGGVSEGELFMDDGLSIDTIAKNAYALYEFKSNKCTLTITSNENTNFKRPKPHLNVIHIFKVQAIATVTPDYNVTVDVKRHHAAVVINDEMNKLATLTWADSSGKCSMLN